MKKFLFLFTFILPLSVQSFSQVVDSTFKVYVMNYRFGNQARTFFDSNHIVVTNLFAENAIVKDENPNQVDEAKVRKTLQKLFRNPSDSGKLVLDWEKKDVFKALRDYPTTDSRYKYAEGEWLKLIGIIRSFRPNVKIGIYGMPFHAWSEKMITRYNPDRKYDEILSLVDFLAPSLYLPYADEEVGHQRNLQYLRENMNVALDYGKRLKKPVYPFFWHRIHDYNKKNGYELMQVDLFANYVKFIATYSYNGYKNSGFYWWEALSKKQNLKKVDGVNGWAKGLVTDYTTYDALMVKYAAAVIKELE